MEYSEAGLQLTKTFEGLRLTSYQDGAGVWTIGYGHTHGVGPGQSCTLQQANQWLIEDVEWAASAVSRLAPWANQNQFDALVDFTFNLGSNALATMLHHGRESVSQQIPRWCNVAGKHSDGLVKRRVKEVELYGS